MSKDKPEVGDVWNIIITQQYFSPTIHIQNFTRDVVSFQDFKETVAEVLAPVPSYEEWKDLKSKLQLKETAYDFDTARLEAENAQLKELLKEELRASQDDDFVTGMLLGQAMSGGLK